MDTCKVWRGGDGGCRRYQGGSRANLAKVELGTNKLMNVLGTLIIVDTTYDSLADLAFERSVCGSQLSCLVPESSDFSVLRKKQLATELVHHIPIGNATGGHTDCWTDNMIWANIASMGSWEGTP